MSRSLLPPHGVFVPTSLIYNSDLSPAVKDTYIQLRGLAWGGTETPLLSMEQFSKLTGKCPSTIYNHIALLRSCGALRMRTSRKGTLMLSFKDVEELALNASPDGFFQDSRNLETPSLKPPKDINLIYKEVVKREDRFQDSGKLESDPVSIYQKSTGIRPNQSQREFITRRVTDTSLWRDTINHWQAHKWNPMNIPGMLDLYKRGGSGECRYCRPDSPSSDPIEQLRKELTHGRTRTNS